MNSTSPPNPSPGLGRVAEGQERSLRIVLDRKLVYDKLPLIMNLFTASIILVLTTLLILKSHIVAAVQIRIRR